VSAFPSEVAGATTHEVGYFDVAPYHLAAWLRDGLGEPWIAGTREWRSVTDAAKELEPSPLLGRYAIVPIASWALVVNNGPRGTDVGLLPSQAARELGCRAIRAVCVGDAGPGYPARILEVYGPDGSGALLLVRSIVAANDGGRWVFETSGDPLAFEHLGEYGRRRKADRFTEELLFRYLQELGVPVGVQPDWANTTLVARA
jgi:hypothetical protein